MRLSLLALLTACATIAMAQREHVPVDNPVYPFLQSMQARGLANGYHPAMLPMSRIEVAHLLAHLDSSRTKLSATEQEYLDDFLIEFQVELGRPGPEPNVFLNFDLPIEENILDAFMWKRKSLYEYYDSTATIVVDGVASADWRFRGGDTAQHVSLLSLGGRVRGTLGGHVGYMIYATNGSLNNGDLALALQDPRLRSNYKLADAEHKNFDVTEGYLLYDNDWFGVELGRESMLFGTGYLDRLVLADHAPPMDFVKLSFAYKSLRYTHIHGSLVHFGFDDSTQLRSTSDLVPKYMALHRLEFDAGTRVRFGFNEMVVYGNKFFQLAYLNPFLFLKSTENSLESYDNSVLGFDVAWRPTDGWQAYAELFVDDFSMSTRGQGARNNKIGYHGGLFASRPFGVNDVNVVVEYTKLDPYVYSHRTDWNFYTNRNISLGADLPPNSDLLSVQFQLRPLHNLGAWLTLGLRRHGESAYDSLGRLLPNGNVGGNVLDAERNPDDPATFLKGRVTSSTMLGVRLEWEPFKQWKIGASFEYDANSTEGVSENDLYSGLRMSVDY